MQQGRGGMGSHKHGISGYSGPSPKFKLNRMLEENRWLQSRTKKRAQRWFASVKDAFKAK